MSRPHGIPKAKVAAYCGLVLAGVPATKASLIVRSTHTILKEYLPPDWFGWGARVRHNNATPIAAVGQLVPRRPMPSGQRAAIYGLLMLGFSTEKIALVLGGSKERVRAYVLPDWMPKACGRKRARADRRERRPRVPPADVIAMHDNGCKTMQEVGEHFGITRERVRQILTRHGIMSRLGGGLPRAVYEDRLQRYYKALQPGVSTLEACAAVDLTYAEVSAAAQNLGVTLPRPIRKGRLRYQEIATYYEANAHLTGKAVAEHFGVHENTVSKAVRVMGVTPRHSGWRWSHPNHPRKPGFEPPKNEASA